MASIFSKLFSKKPAAKIASSDFAPATVNAAGFNVGARPHQSPAWIKEYTPERIASVLENAERGDEYALIEYFKLADLVIEREMHTAGVINGLALSITGLPHTCKPPKGDKTKRAQKLADEATELFSPTSTLRRSAPGIVSQGITHGLCVAAVQWDTDNPALWVPEDYIQKPAHFFMFDRTDARTPLLRSEQPGQPATPIDPGTSLVFAPRRNSAMQIKNGLAWILCWSWVIKSICLADQQAFIANFGHPAILGTYKHGTDQTSISALNRAVNALNSSFRGVFREDMTLDFKELSHTNTDIYEKLCRYLDESVSKVVWASTLTTDQGRPGAAGSYALGKIHSESKYDVIRSYAQQWAASLQLVVNAYIAWNYGPDAPVPQVVVDVEEAEDLVAKSEIIKNLAGAGVSLVASEIREAYGFREPQPGDEVIGGTPIAPTSDGTVPLQPQGAAKAPNPAQNARSSVDLGRGCPEHSAHATGAQIRDAIDDLADAMLSDWATETASIDAALQSAVAGAGDIEEMRAALLEAVNKIDTTQLTAMFTKARTTTRVAGHSGADL